MASTILNLSLILSLSLAVGCATKAPDLHFPNEQKRIENTNPFDASTQPVKGPALSDRMANIELAVPPNGQGSETISLQPVDRDNSLNAGFSSPTGADPNAAVPNAAVPNAAVPNAAVPNAAVPNPADLNAAVPNAAVPNPAVPNAAVPNPAVPNPAVPNAAVPNAAATNATRGVPVAETKLDAYLQVIGDDVASQLFGKAFNQTFYVCEVVIHNPFANPLLVSSSAIAVPVNFYVTKKDFEKPEVKNSLPKGYLTDFRRPATFSDVLAVFDYQRKGNLKQQIINIGTSAGEIAAAATVFVGGPAYPKAVALATGVVLPELEKNLLWDLVAHAKNLESASLKELTEIEPLMPARGLVFFPKRPMPGIVPGAKVYISNFETRHPVAVRGVIINKIAGAQSEEVSSK